MIKAVPITFTAPRMPVGRVACLLCAVLLILAPQIGWPIMPAVRGYLMLKIDFRRSVDRVTDQVRAASAASLNCAVIPFEPFGHLAYHGGVRCTPFKVENGEFQGAIVVNSIERKKIVTVGVESIDAVPHHITVHPNVERALQAFKNAIDEDDNVERFQECLWSDLEACTAPLPD